MAFKIYTKTGDKGTTGLLGGKRVSKGSLRISAYGTLDTLNAYMGWVGDLQDEDDILLQIREIQDRLFTIGSLLAVDPDKELKMKLPNLEAKDITFLEEAIDKMDAEVPPMRSFVLPGGHVAVSACHIARCHCREAERLCVTLEEQKEKTGPLLVPYLNRLSDYLFMLSRYTAMKLKIEEIPWKARK